MDSYPKTVRLKNGTEVVLRRLMPDDLDALHRFYLNLPEEDRHYLRTDVTDRRNVAMQMEDSDAEERTRLVAVRADAIVGQAALLRPTHGWSQHTAELRCVVGSDVQEQGLAKIMIRELFQEATRQGVEIVFSKTTAEQKAATHIVTELGFKPQVTLREHQRTLHGDLHDVILMTCSISDAWARLEDLIHHMDYQGEVYPPPRRAES